MHDTFSFFSTNYNASLFSQECGRVSARCSTDISRGVASTGARRCGEKPRNSGYVNRI